MNLLSLLLAQDDVVEAPAYRYGSYFFPESASSFAHSIDWVFYFIFWVCVIFFAIIVGVMVYFVVKYRRRPGVDPEPSSSHNTPLEIAWSVIPSLLLILMFKWGAEGYFEQRFPSDDAEIIRVTARQFQWMFEYDDGDFSNVLHLTRNRKYEFRMESKDVIHSFFIPAFRQKQDVVPGRYSTMWIQPTKTGEFRIYCAEYCGSGHSTMKTKVVIHETEAERKTAVAWDWKGHGESEEGRIENGHRIFQVRM